MCGAGMNAGMLTMLMVLLMVGGIARRGRRI